MLVIRLIAANTVNTPGIASAPLCHVCPFRLTIAMGNLSGCSAIEFMDKWGRAWEWGEKAAAPRWVGLPNDFNGTQSTCGSACSVVRLFPLFQGAGGSRGSHLRLRGGTRQGALW